MENILRNRFSKAMSILVLAAFMLIVAFPPEVAEAGAKSLIVGAAAGAGLVLAWPTITAAVGCAAGAIGSVVVGAGTAIATGVGAVSGAVAVGGAAAGGAVAGAGAAVGSAVTAGFGAVGGAIAAVTASPLFVPALLVIGAVIAGVLIYKYIKKKKASSPGRISEPTAVSGGRPVSAPPVTSSTKGKDKSGYTPPEASGSVREAYEKYQAAYKRYIDCLRTDSSGTAQETQRALEDLRIYEKMYRKAMGK